MVYAWRLKSLYSVVLHSRFPHHCTNLFSCSTNSFSLFLSRETIMDDSAAQRTLERYLYDYMVKKNMDQTAEIFRREAKLCFDPTLPPLVDAPEGFLHEWWTIFHDMFRSRMAANKEQRDEDNSVCVVLQTEEPTKTAGSGKQSDHLLASSSISADIAGCTAQPLMGSGSYKHSSRWSYQ